MAIFSDSDASPASLSYSRSGSGPPLLLIHGLGSSRSVWNPVLSRITAQRTAIAIDLPGFGTTPALPAHVSHSIEVLTDSVESFISEQNLDHPSAVGNSLGASIALELARRGSVRSAVALAPAGFYTPIERFYVEMSLRLLRRLGIVLGPLTHWLMRSSAIRSIMLCQLLRHPSRISADEISAHIDAMLNAPGFQATLKCVGSYRFQNGSPITVPVTIGWGTHDWLLLPRQGVRAQAQIPQAKLAWLRGCGHDPMDDDPEQVAELILSAS